MGRARFDTIDFGIDVAANPRLPRPTTEEGTGVKRWSGQIVLKSRADIEALESLVTIAQIKPAAGLVNSGVVNISAGPGSKAFIFPDGDGNDLECTAILTTISSDSALNTQDAYRATVTFVLTTEPA